MQIKEPNTKGYLNFFTDYSYRSVKRIISFRTFHVDAQADNDNYLHLTIGPN